MAERLHVAVFPRTEENPSAFAMIYSVTGHGMHVECVLEPANDNFERRDRTWRKN